MVLVRVVHRRRRALLAVLEGAREAELQEVRLAVEAEGLVVDVELGGGDANVGDANLHDDERVRLGDGKPGRDHVDRAAVVVSRE